ncbi:methyl-accepting chemotaxis protein [Anaerobacterium chartisolvens]|uniref:Methyl-accepting chemotaxis protein n=1 Tax=Anaerobacterium chartisolvens TaxID=1297424 RepID=A0A369AW65_9FIRM|nr:methyl-accepting chemotaxis protein [Anaerobacterium chartisolvens]RCX13549.1 methyl-accepting chemotaxis protein [Anaerobacterium chartisolvens]
MNSIINNITKLIDPKKTRQIKTSVSNAFSHPARLFRGTGIQLRLIASFTAISVITLGITGFLSYTKSSNAIVSKMKSYSLQMTKQLSLIAETRLNVYNSYILELSISKTLHESLENIDSDDVMVVLNSRRNVTDMISTKLLDMRNIISTDLFKTGTDNSISYGSSVINSNKELRDSLIKMVSENQQKTVWTYYINPENATENCIILGRKIVSLSSSSTIGHIFICLRPQAISSIFDNADLGDNSQIMVMDSSANMISGRNDKDFGTTFEEKSILENFSGSDGGTFDYKIEGKDCLISFSRLESQDWYIVISTPYKYIYAEPDGIRNFVLAFFIICMALSFILSFILTKSISAPLGSLTRFMSETKNGNLTMEIKDDGKDEIARLTQSFNEMVQNIRALVSKVHSSFSKVLDSSEKIAASSQHSYSASEQISLTIQEIAKGASEQASQIAQSMEHMSRLSYGINKVSSDVANVSSVVSNTKILSQNALNAVSILNGKAEDTKAITSEISSEINALNNDMKEIEKIVRVIVGIAEQTNLLSLNAAIEAARAGEAGKGFAVVADEVKKLADQSKNASVMINNILSGIRNRTAVAVEKANSASDIINQQSDSVSHTDYAFKTILNSMEDISKQISHMENSASEMSMFREKTISAMENVSAVSQQSAATSQEVSASTQEQIAGAEELAVLAKDLSAISLELDAAISQFKI